MSCRKKIVFQKFFVKIKDNLHIGILHVEKSKNNNILKSLIFFGIFN